MSWRGSTEALLHDLADRPMYPAPGQRLVLMEGQMRVMRHLAKTPDEHAWLDRIDRGEDPHWYVYRPPLIPLGPVDLVTEALYAEWAAPGKPFIPLACV